MIPSQLKKTILLSLVKLMVRYTLCQIFLINIIKALYVSGQLHLSALTQPIIFLQLFLFITLIVPSSVTITPPMEMSGRIEEEMKRANDLKEKELEIIKNKTVNDTAGVN